MLLSLGLVIAVDDFSFAMSQEVKHASGVPVALIP